MKYTNREIERKLSSATEKMVPKDMFGRIEQNIVPRKERTAVNMTNIKKTKKSVKWISVAVAACLLIAVGVFGVNYYSNNMVEDSIVDIDVNPSVEIVTNKRDKVIKVNVTNDDAGKLLDGMDLEKTDLNVAVNAIIGSMVKHGYLNNGDNEILVTVQNSDIKKAEAIRNMVVVNIDNTLEEKNLTASVINQTMNDSADNAKKFADKHNISIGKAVFVLKLAAKDASLDADKLATMKIREIADIVREKNIDISDIVDYDADDSVWENITDEIEDINENDKDDDDDKVVNTDGVITADQAKEIALKHAGLAADKVKFKKAELNTDDGAREYDIEFCDGNLEYEYEINAETGAVISADKEKDDCKLHNGSGNENSNGTGSGNGNGGGGNGSAASIITAAKAKSIALNHAGLSASEVTFIKVERDRDNGVQVYEVEFCKGNYEYDYEINAETGKIIEWDKEYDD